MDKSAILEKLKSIRNGLPEELVLTENASEVMANANKYFRKVRDKYNDLEMGISEDYDKEAVMAEETNRKNLIIQRKKASEELSSLLEDEEFFEESISYLGEEIEKDENRIQKLEELNRSYDEQLSRATSDFDKENITREKERYEKRTARIKARLDANKKKLEEHKDSLKKAKKAIEDKRKERTELRNKAQDAKERIEKLKTSPELTEEEREHWISDLKALYTLSKYVNANPKEELSKIISDYESGTINEEEVNTRVRDLKVLMSGGLYDTVGIERELTTEEIVEKRNRLNEEINELTLRVEDDAWYMDKTPEYDVLFENVFSINSDIEKIGEDRAALEAEKVEDANTIRRNDEEIKNIDAYIKRRTAAIEAFNVPEPVKRRALEEIKPVLDAKRRRKDDLVKQNESLSEKVKTYYPVKEEVLNSKEADKLAEKEELTSKMRYLNEPAREKDKERLKELKTLMIATYAEGATVKNSLEEDLDDVILLTGGRGEIDEAPSFVRKFNDEQKEVYDKLMEGLTPEDKEKIESVAGKKAEEAAKSPGAKEKAEEEKIPDGPKTKVRKFKDLAKDKWKKITDFFKNNWKKVVKISALIGTATLLLFCENCGEKKNTVDNSKPEYKNEQQIDPEVIEIGLAEKKETPDVTYPVINPEVKDDTKAPEETKPDPGTVPEEKEEEKHETYHLETKSPTETGSSAPADENEPFIEGTSIYDPNTNTWLTADDTKITGNPDGTYDVEHNAGEIDAVHDGVVDVVDPDMSPAEPKEVQETPQVPAGETLEEPKSVEEAVEQGLIDEEAAAEYIDFFEEAFDDLYAEQSNGRGK